MPPMKLQNSGGGGDISDGNVSGGESDHSNTSRENDAGRDSSEDEADSDESSDMDEGECETRRSALLQHVQDLENQFSLLREQLYNERMEQVENQLEEVKAGRSPDYLGPLKEFEEQMNIRVEVARTLKNFKHGNLHNQYYAEDGAARQNFESEKQLAYDYYYSELMDTIRKLEEDRHNSEITWGEGGEWGSRSRSRIRRKAVTVSGPYIVYMLKPQDIMEDWTIIRKALKRSQ